MATASAEPTEQEPRRFAWLRPPKGGPDGTMSLFDHLKELRYRVTISAFAFVVAAIGCIFFYKQLIAFVLAPWRSAVAVLDSRIDTETMLVNNGVGGAFALAVLVCAIGGVFFSAPIWLYQIWAFVAPGLLAKEKKYTLGYLAVAVPLFFAGAAMGYYVWPKGIEVLLGFTPENEQITNMIDMSNFLGMEVKVMLVFGLSFLLPVIVVALNMAGVVRGYQLKKARKGVIFGSAVLAAVATPTTDPFSMLALMVPVTAMFLIAEVICRAWDKKRGISEADAAEFAIDLDDGE